jgi:hypothetical protein
VNIETFKLHDQSTIDKLHVNLKGEENSAQSYLKFMLALLHLNPVLTQKQLEAEILEHFGPSFGPSDRRMMRVGAARRQPKWKNTLAWAKVHGRKQGLIAQRRHGEELYLVLLAQSKEHAEFQRWSLNRAVKKMRKIKLKRKPNRRAHKIVIG